MTLSDNMESNQFSNSEETLRGDKKRPAKHIGCVTQLKKNKTGLIRSVQERHFVGGHFFSTLRQPSICGNDVHVGKRADGVTV